MEYASKDNDEKEDLDGEEDGREEGAGQEDSR
jgi:hypothetical protein